MKYVKASVREIIFSRTRKPRDGDELRDVLTDGNTQSYFGGTNLGRWLPILCFVQLTMSYGIETVFVCEVGVVCHQTVLSGQLIKANQMTMKLMRRSNLGIAPT